MRLPYVVEIRGCNCDITLSADAVQFLKLLYISPYSSGDSKRQTATCWCAEKIKRAKKIKQAEKKVRGSRFSGKAEKTHGRQGVLVRTKNIVHLMAADHVVKTSYVEDMWEVEDDVR
jgi:hypothetical protein